jgi:UDP-N-acetylmuramate--alanine ligase
MNRKTKHIHFVGIGGIGMSGIAELLLTLGYKVSGSDLHGSAITENLSMLGGVVYKGHQSEWMEGADVVVTSSAISSTNPEVVRAKETNVPVIMRAEMLAELMRLKKYGIAIAGSHGKTSTTSMVSWMLASAGLDPTIVIGGRVDALGGNAKMGASEYLVAEADESDGSFLKLSPVVEVITNIDLEHLDFYRDIDHIKSTFLEFIDKIPFYGAAIVCLDDVNIADILPLIKKRTITYGLTPQADIYADDIVWLDGRIEFTVKDASGKRGRINIAPPGIHNVYNALAVVCVGLELELSFEKIQAGLQGYAGVQRRMQLKGEIGGITIVDDYGHHPTEIRATLEAIKQAWPQKRLVVLFQPHRYSRTQGLFKEFQTCFHKADYLIMSDIYAASEEPISGVTGESLLEATRLHGQRHTRYIGQIENMPEEIRPMLRKGDLVLTLGAGDIVRVGEELLLLLEKETQQIR